MAAVDKSTAACSAIAPDCDDDGGVQSDGSQLEVRGPPPSVTDRYYTKHFALGG